MHLIDDLFYVDPEHRSQEFEDARAAAVPIKGTIKVAWPMNVPDDRAQGDILSNIKKDVLQLIAPTKHHRLVMNPFKGMCQLVDFIPVKNATRYGVTVLPVLLCLILGH
jgi:hypothetical protein